VPKSDAEAHRLPLYRRSEAVASSGSQSLKKASVVGITAAIVLHGRRFLPGRATLKPAGCREPKRVSAKQAARD
jgi:hypothetical protein